ncbi:hypothetical protein L1S32_09680 [Methanogenium sp. S4BF]|uniref:hypothetical protein n=1 Tax=Methanogenium sp. S4BF TaxID=1789226 RepID=UPI002415EFD3|nr:hypothetical protein [Methanogenium sp. S4BF]WFN34110.1 hypothetical protein L1S32_09680 [Methanogenium sp. S4BF]
MSLNDRWIGAELSGVERELACNTKYENVGYVEYYRNDPRYFYLHPSPFLKTRPSVLYVADPSVVPQGPPPEHRFIRVHVIDEERQPLDAMGNDWLTFRDIGGWEEFDVSSLARQRKIMDFHEVIEFFAYPYDGEADCIEEIAGCSALFAFSAPPMHDETGGIRSAVFGKKHQWDVFRRPFEIIPKEFRRVNSYYYYLFSNTETAVRKSEGEINQAVLKPQKLIADIPVAIDNESGKKLSPEYRDVLKEESGIITGQLLDGLFIRPESTAAIEKVMTEAVYELREEYLSSGQRPFRQNISGAIPKLASSYARLQSSSDIRKDDIKYVMDLWSSMSHKTEKIQSSALKVRDAFALTGDAKTLYYRLSDVYGADCPIPFKDAVKTSSLDPLDFKLAYESLEERGYCLIVKNNLTLLEPYTKE